MLYAELGAGGGRKGPKPEPMESNYAQVKVDEMGYPARGPASDMSQPAPYPTSINRDRSRRHSPPPNYGEMDDDDGVIVWVRFTFYQCLLGWKSCLIWFVVNVYFVFCCFSIVKFRYLFVFLMLSTPDDIHEKMIFISAY